MIVLTGTLYYSAIDTSVHAFDNNVPYGILKLASINVVLTAQV